jgi:hypothetical protein
MAPGVLDRDVHVTVAQRDHDERGESPEHVVVAAVPPGEDTLDPPAAGA